MIYFGNIFWRLVNLRLSCHHNFKRSGFCLCLTDELRTDNRRLPLWRRMMPSSGYRSEIEVWGFMVDGWCFRVKLFLNNHNFHSFLIFICIMVGLNRKWTVAVSYLRRWRRTMSRPVPASWWPRTDSYLNPKLYSWLFPLSPHHPSGSLCTRI